MTTAVQPRPASSRVSCAAGISRQPLAFCPDHSGEKSPLSDRASRLAALAAQYQSGNYHPDAAAVSRRMIDDAIDSRSQAG